MVHARAFRTTGRRIFLAAALLAFADCGPPSVPAAGPRDAKTSGEDDPIALDAGSGNPNTPNPNTGGGSACRASTTCGDCIQKIACGWCPTTGTCESGDQNGPTNVACADFGITQATCSVMPPQQHSANCPTHRDCASCTGENGCGFCASSGSCLAGASSGPTGNACADWDFYPNDCAGSNMNTGTAASCATHASCGDCSSENGCGWCESSSRCIPGSTRGPANGTCNRWEYGAASCSACDTSSTCDDCTTTTGCGWCNDRNVCEAGSSSGPTTGFCANWNTSQRLCTTPTTNTCASQTDCDACAMASGCGWCAAMRRCESGTSMGPTSGSCTDWDYVASACMPSQPTPRDAGTSPSSRDGGPTPQPRDAGSGPTNRDSGVSTPPDAGADPCSANLACDECTYAAGCGWCDDNQDCESGNTSGPWTGSCNTWAWAPASCPGGNGMGTDPCASWSTCQDCTTASACGFCNSDSTCSSGTSSGPSTGSCADWAWISSSCTGSTPPTGPDPCASAAATCGDCTQLAGCGWCGDNSACESGDANGAADGACTAWSWYSYDCGASSDPCAGAASTCDDCTLLSGCGYCNDTQSCASGDANGDFAGSCTDWAWYQSSCTTSGGPDPCAGYICGDCTTLADCGYCNSTDTCETGDANGPTNSFCSDWAWLSSSCVGSSPSDPCATAAYSCDDCTTLNGCGWCDDNYSCESGSSTGPSSGACSSWSWISAECSASPSDPCATAAYTCGDCTALNGCGWCDDNYSCESGSSTGPSSGFCSGWSWYASDCGSSTPSDPCATAAYTCGDCTALNGCGWCDDNYSCASGDSNGPSSFGCFSWSWYSTDCP